MPNQPAQLPHFDEAKTYVLKGSTLNTLMESIIKEIMVDKREIKLSKRAANKVELRLAWPVPPPPEEGDYVLTASGGVMAWEAVEEC